MKKTYCSLEYPFTANQMYVPVGRGQLVKSKKYRDWLDKNLPIIKESLSSPEKYPIEIQLTIFSNDSWVKKNDIDNLIKPTIDLLVKSNILPDDSCQYIENVNIRHVWMTGCPTLSISYYSVDKD